MAEVNKCRYCENKFKSKSETADMCGKCYDKFPYVKELVAICRKIKRGERNDLR
jgi:hypothetical protein